MPQHAFSRPLEESNLDDGGGSILKISCSGLLIHGATVLTDERE
jgi:hypothetical protein